MKETNIKIRRYEHGDFYIDIVETDETYEAWMLEKTGGESELMFGVMKGDYDFFLEIVEANIDEYIKDFYDGCENILEAMK